MMIDGFLRASLHQPCCTPQRISAQQTNVKKADPWADLEARTAGFSTSKKRRVSP